MYFERNFRTTKFMLNIHVNVFEVLKLGQSTKNNEVEKLQNR